MISPSKLKDSARELLYGTPLFFPVREAYQSILDRKRLAARKEKKAFYRQFIRPGDLVFDVGAHFGTYAETFASLGARVIAIEPNPVCLGKLHRLAKVSDVQVLNVAAGDTPGQLKLHVCVEHPDLSTVTDEWYEAALHSPRHGNPHWQEPIQVPVLTLDAIAGQYGQPAFVKIDAEGFDDRVLRGMSFQPPALSFEFNRDVPDVGLRCFQAPVLARGYEFNFTCGAGGFVSDQWMSPDEVCERIFSAERYFGDVIGRRLST